jgi:hypothetical protein
MKYKVIEDFKDLEYNNHDYSVGDIYPVEGSPEPSQDRINDLLGTNNKLGRPVIQEEEKKKRTKKETKETTIQENKETTNQDMNEVINPGGE